LLSIKLRRLAADSGEFALFCVKLFGNAVHDSSEDGLRKSRRDVLIGTCMQRQSMP
jgi:hypothetical protein